MAVRGRRTPNISPERATDSPWDGLRAGKATATGSQRFALAMLRIRQAAPADIGWLGDLKLRASLAWGEHVEELQALPEARTFPAGDLGFAFVAESASGIVGFATVLPRPDGRAELEDLFVEPRLWRGGIGRRLVEAAERRAVEMGARALHVVANGRARGFYEACGFEVVGMVQTRFTPAPEMEKPLRQRRSMRVAVLGTSGAGKSTFAASLAGEIGAPHVELDAINWQAGWRDLNSHDPEEFVRRVEAAVAADAWVSDGNYSRVRDLVLARATHVVWLDYPRPVVMARVFRRSLSRALTGRELWPGTGNREEFRRWLDKEHPLCWAWDTYHDRRKRYAALFETAEVRRLERYRLQRPGEAGPLIERLAAEGRLAPRLAPPIPGAGPWRSAPAGRPAPRDPAG